MLGGDGTFAAGAYAERTLSNMPAHTALRIQLTLFKLNKWNGERLQVLVDGHVAYSTYPLYQGGSHHCSVSTHQQEDLAFEVDALIDHYDSNATIRVISTLATGAIGKFWGLNDVHIVSTLAYPSPPLPPSPPGLWTGDNGNARYLLHDRWPGATGWTGTANASKVTTCGALGTALGGYGVFGAGAYAEKALSNLPPHSAMRLQMRIQRIDKWEGEKILVLVDGHVAYESYQQWRGGRHRCGVDGHQQEDDSFWLDVTINHFSPNATIRVASTATASRYWGLQDVMVRLVLDHPSPPLPPSPPGLWTGDNGNARYLLHDRWPGATGWTGTANASKVTTCGALGTALGGYGVFGAGAYAEKALSNLPPHSAMRLQMRIQRIDKWEGEKILVLVDGHVAYESYQQWRGGRHRCGVDGHQQEDDSFWLDVTINHFSPNATIRVASTATASRYWGLQDVMVRLVLDHPSPPLPPSPPGLWTASQPLLVDRWPGALGWSGTIPNKHRTCGRLGTMLGPVGRASYLEKNVTDLPQHSALRIQMVLIRMNKWHGGRLYVYVDGKPIWTSSSQFHGGSHECGSNGHQQQDAVIAVDATTYHTSSNLSIRIDQNPRRTCLNATRCVYANE